MQMMRKILRESCQMRSNKMWSILNEQITVKFHSAYLCLLMTTYLKIGQLWEAWPPGLEEAQAPVLRICQMIGFARNVGHQRNNLKKFKIIEKVYDGIC